MYFSNIALLFKQASWSVYALFYPKLRLSQNVPFSWRSRLRMWTGGVCRVLSATCVFILDDSIFSKISRTTTRLPHRSMHLYFVFVRLKLTFGCSPAEHFLCTNKQWIRFVSARTFFVTANSVCCIEVFFFPTFYTLREAMARPREAVSRAEFITEGVGRMH